MKLRNIIFDRKVKIFLYIFLSLLLSYLLFRFFKTGYDSVISFLSSLSDSYLSLNEKLSNLILYWTKDRVVIDNHTVVLENITLSVFIPETRYKQVAAFILLLIWLTKTSYLKKSLYSVLIIAVQFIVSSVYMAIGAHLAGFEYYDKSILAIPDTAAFLSLFTILFIWYIYHKIAILERLSKLRVNTKFIDKKDTSVIVLIYIYIILSYFLLEYFDYGTWITLLFTSSQKMLDMVGVKATVEPFYLVGSEGSIYMAKYCLGFKTMFLFASVVYLTGEKNRIRWIYIFAGILFLNFVNILRFVFLFIHIQKNGGYALSMDLHDMYNYITYSVVFVLWVIWFEKFSDMKPRSKNTVYP